MNDSDTPPEVPKPEDSKDMEALRRQITELQEDVIRLTRERDAYHKTVKQFLRTIESPMVDEIELDEARRNPIDFREFLRQEFPSK